MEISKIEQVILDANLDRSFNPRTGDCVSIAVSIKELFGGVYVCGYQYPPDLCPAHATVKIQGTLVDGNGTLNEDTLYDIATSGLKPHSIQEKENHIHMVEHLKKNPLHDRETKRKVKEKLGNNMS